MRAPHPRIPCSVLWLKSLTMTLAFLPRRRTKNVYAFGHLSPLPV
jgi:hypothetical protein